MWKCFLQTVTILNLFKTCVDSSTCSGDTNNSIDDFVSIIGGTASSLFKYKLSNTSISDTLDSNQK